MSGPADQGVRVGGEGVVDVVPGQGDPASRQNGTQNVVHHLAIGAA